MQLQGREQAKNRLRYLGGDGNQALVFGTRAWQAIEATADLLELASGTHARQHYPRDADRVQIVGAQHPLLGKQVDNTLGLSGFTHGWKYVPFIRQKQVSDE